MNSDRRFSFSLLRQVFLGVACLTTFVTGQALAQQGDESVQVSPTREASQTWSKAWPRLIKAEEESQAAISAAIKDVEGSFDRANENARSFVVDILATWGKYQYAVGGARKAVNLGAGFVDGIFGTKLGQPAETDSFEVFVRSSFVDRVLDPAVFRRSVEGAVESYRSKLASIEAKLLVELQADLPDGGIQMPRISVPRLNDAMSQHVDSAVTASIADAGTDFAFMAGKETVSQLGGGWISGMVLSGASAVGLGQALTQSNDPYSAVALGTGILIGVAVDKALDKVAEAAGHDPAGELVKKVQARLGSARNLVIEGEDKDRTLHYNWFTFLRAAHPDDGVRNVCSRAADYLESRYFLGLRPILEVMHMDRTCARRLAIHQSIFGPEASVPTDLYASEENLAKGQKVVGWAKQYLDR